MLLDTFAGVADAALLTSAASQLRQRWAIEGEALRAIEEVARRQRETGAETMAARAAALAEAARAATPWLTLADECDALAHALKHGPARGPRA